MKKIIFTFILAIFLVGCSEKDVSYETIDLDEIEEKVNDGYIVLDVREVDEFESGHIPGAVNKPLSELQEANFSNIDKNDKYVVICRSGNRSVTASNILVEEGYTVVNTSDGMGSWQGEIE